MNIEHLQLFVRVAALSNISQAGKELGLSAAVSSAQLNKLEQDLGVRLIHRTTRKVSLTEDGHAFLPYAEDVLASLEAAKAAVGVGSTMPKGNLRISAPASFGRMHLVRAIKEFMSLYPDISVDMRLSDNIIDLVEGGFDVAIRDAALNDSSLIARKLAKDTRLVVASPQYIAQFGVPKTPEDLMEHRCLTLIGLDTWRFTDDKKPINIKVKGQYRVDNGEAVRDACAQGLGVTISSQWCAYKHLESGELVPILTDYPLASDTSIWAVYPSSRQLAAKVRVFIDFLADYFGDTPYWEQE